MVFSIRLTEEEKKIANSYAEINAISLATAFKKALFEKIEEEYDIAIANKNYEEYLQNPKSRPIQYLWDELGL